MNSEEGMSMAKMAVTVLLVILVIGAVVTIVYAAYSWFSSGTDKLTDTVTSIDKSSFSQYDDQQVSGSAVLAALKSYRESDIAIFVSNASLGAYSADGISNSVKNYCALVKGATEVTSGANKGTYDVKLTYTSDGKYTFESFAYTDDTGVSINRNTNFSPTTTVGASNSYVKQSAKWYAKLVYDASTDEIGGILFMQMK